MKDRIKQLSSTYSVKIFSEKDIPEIYALCKGNDSYYKYMKIEPSHENLEEVLRSLPPNISMDHKFFIGFYYNDELIAILDLILEYPNKETAYIGWFMIKKENQRKGIGRKLITELCLFLTKEGFHFVELGYIKKNEEAQNFWEKNRFFPSGKETKTDEFVIVSMQRKIKRAIHTS